MKTNKQARREGKQLFRACLVDGLLDEDRAREAVADVLARKPRGYLAILTYFQHLVRLHMESRTARIESPVPLDDRQKSAIAAQVSSRYGKGLVFYFAENTQLIGGLRVRVGSDVIDGSVRGRLAALEQTLAD
jgi:F-type H+-transporting ATPase subunit delta